MVFSREFDNGTIIVRYAKYGNEWRAVAYITIHDSEEMVHITELYTDDDLAVNIALAFARNYIESL